MSESVERRVERYVERQIKTRTAWPTVRRTARSLGLRFAEVEEVASRPDGNLQLTSYFAGPDGKLGDLFVETINSPEAP